MSTSSLSSRALGRRQVVAVAAALAAFGGVALYRSQAGAGAHESHVDLKMTCGIAGPITVSYTIDHEPESGAVAGEPFTLDVKSTVALDPATPEVAVKTMKIVIPRPAGVSAGGDVMVMGGNLTKAGQSDGGADLVLDLVADTGVTSKTLQVPDLMIPVLIDEAAGGQSIDFHGPSSLQLGVEVAATAITETCTADAGNPALLTVRPSGGTPGPTETTEPPAPGTTAAPGSTTTTSGAPTPTTAPGVSGSGSSAGGSAGGGAPTAVVATPSFTG